MKKEKKKPEKTMKKKAPVKKIKNGQTIKNKPEQKLRVLILEDNPADAELMERQLRRDRIVFTAQRVETKARFIKALRNFEPDLVLADYTLPDFDAISALALARKLFPLIPFIIITGSIGEERAVACLRAGADDYLLKDRMARLGEAAKHALETRRLQSEKARTEAALQANERLYHAFINASADMAFLKDDQFRHLLANRELCRFYEKSEIEIIGKTDAELMDKSAAARCRKTDRLTLAKNKVQVSEETVGGLTFETRKFPVKLTDGRIGVGGYIRDISERKHTQGQIEKAAQKWNITFDAIKDGIALLAVDQTIMQANKAFADIINKPFKEIIGKKCYKLIHSDQQPDRHCPFKKMLKSKKRESMELVIAERTFDIIVDPIKNNDGAITGAAHIISDITERKRAEELQQATSSRLELALYSAKAGTWDWNVLTNHIEWSPQMFKLFGLDPQSNSASFASWRTVLYPEDREGAENSIDQALKQHKTLNSDYRIILPGGQIRWINAVGVGVYDNSGRPIQMIGICQDISERKQTEKSLRESEKKFRDLAELLPQTVFETDLQGMLTFVNRAAFASFGYHKNDFKGGLQIWQMLVPGDRTRAATNIKRLMAGASTGGTEYTALRKDGSEFPILLYSALIQTSGHPTGIRGILVDISERKQSENALRESEERFANLFQRAPLGYQSLDADGCFLEVNEAWLEALGYRREEIIGKWFGDFLAPEFVAVFRKRFPVFKTAGAIHSEFEMIHKNGQRRTFAFEGRVGHRKDGSFEKTHCILQDITERKRAEEVVRESERALKKAQHIGCLGSWEWDIACGRLTWSDELYRIWGVAKGFALTQDNITSLIHPDDRATNAAKLAEILESGADVQFEFRIVRPDGATRTLLQIVEVSRDAAGKAVRIAGIMQDITERKRAEEALRDSEEKYRSIVEMTSEWIWEIDLNGMHMFSNPGITNILGYRPDEFVGQKAISLMHEEDRSKVETALVRLIAEKRGWRDWVLRWRHKDGSYRFLESNANPILDSNGQLHGYLGSDRDITERKRAEKQIQASLHEKEVLLKEIHHRVKNNLQVISGLLTLQAAQTNDERLQRMIKESQSRIWTMALIHQTLYQSGNMASINMADYIRSLCGNLLSSHAQLAMPPNIIFDVLPLQLSIDKAIPLALIINELVTNAMKHAFADGRTGEIRIGLQEYRDRSRPVPTDLGRAYTFELTVADNGVGLPAGFDAKNQKSLGLQLVGMLTQQLAGQFAMESTAGTAVHILFDQNEKTQEQS